MKKGAKPPEIRKQELVDIALRLFLQRGYENVSVKDILDEIQGQRGMFYHYFKDKRDIYRFVMEQFTKTAVNGYKVLLSDKQLTLRAKIDCILEMMQKNAQTYADALAETDDAAHILFMTTTVLRELAIHVSQMFMKAIENGEIPPTSIVNKENTLEIALFIISGCNSLLREQYSSSQKEISVDTARKFIYHMLNI